MSKIGQQVWPLPWEHDLKIHYTKKNFKQNLLQITIHIFQCKNLFDRPMGVASALIAQFDFLAKNALKMCYTKVFARQKVLKIKICNFYVM